MSHFFEQFIIALRYTDILVLAHHQQTTDSECINGGMLSFFNANCLKSEKNKKFKKHDYSTSSIHKKSICIVLLQSSARKEGMSVKEIHEKLKFLTERTIFNLLNELRSEDKVFKSKMKYYLKDLFIDDGWSIFAEFLNEFQREYYLNKISSLKIYSSEQTLHNELENAILNFGNVIGAFIIYVLIESLRPNERKIPISDRHQILKDFLQNAINISLVYTRFLRILPGNPDRISSGKR